MRLIAVAVCLANAPTSAHHHRVPYSACHPRDIPRKAVIGGCYVSTRGTYAGWKVPGVRPELV